MAAPEAASTVYTTVPNVVVRLADDWPPGGATVVLRCSPACTSDIDGTPIHDQLVDSTDGGVAGFDVHGRELTRLATDLDFQRVGGTEECGGPVRATVTVPAP